MTPLDKALKASKSICCSNCKNRTVVNGVNYCSISGKLLMDRFLDSDRSNCCKDKFKEAVKSE